jgi:hypothetical protein
MYVIAYVRASVFVCVCVLMRAYVQSCVLLSENSNAKDGHLRDKIVKNYNCLTLIVSNLKKIDVAVKVEKSYWSLRPKYLTRFNAWTIFVHFSYFHHTSPLLKSVGYM